MAPVYVLRIFRLYIKCYAALFTFLKIDDAFSFVFQKSRLLKILFFFVFAFLLFPHVGTCITKAKLF